MNKDLHNMLERFPNERKNIIDLYGSNEDFRTLCEDYWQSKKALLKPRDKRISDALLEDEYSGLCLELEREALHFIRLVSG